MRNESAVTGEKRLAHRAARPGDRTVPRPGVHELDGGDGLWRVADVSAYLRVPISSIYKMTARHAAVHIPHIRIGGALRFRHADIDRWLSLLTISNLDVLTTMRERIQKVTHADHSQTAPRER